MIHIVGEIAFAIMLLGMMVLAWRACVVAIAVIVRWPALGLIGLALGVWWAMRPAAPVSEAAAYREAQRAVEAATGVPCDYACKVMIADRARQPVDK